MNETELTEGAQTVDSAESAEGSSPLGVLFSAAFLIACAIIVAAAVYGLAHSHLWDVAPTILQRGVDR